MHWVWASEPTAEGEARIYGPPPIAEELNLEFDAGLVVSASVPLIEVIQDEHSQGVLPDNVILLGGGGLLFSSRLRQVLAAVPLDNVQYYPAVVRNRVDGTETSDYHIANIVGRMSCLDRQNSVLEMAPDDPELIDFIEVLAIDEVRANGFDLFRLSEEPEVIIASERVKEACERQRITGVRFYRPREYQL
jgi:hypothetical protein